jgi:lysophospholipase L1-like esterase
MKALQIVLIALTSLSGCTKKAVNAPLTTANSTTMTKVDTLSYLALGDSYTIGEAVPQNQSYPYQLTDSLKAQSIQVGTPTIIATTGWTTDDLISAISRSGIHSETFSFVTLLIGVNDQYQHLSQDNYKVKFTTVLNTAIAFANGDTSRVFVLSIPDYGVTPFANGQDGIIGPQIDQFNAINKAISLAAGVNYLDITAISRLATADRSLIAPDGLHPSGKMYSMWVKLLEPMVAARLK